MPNMKMPQPRKESQEHWTPFFALEQEILRQVQFTVNWRRNKRELMTPKWFPPLKAFPLLFGKIKTAYCDLHESC